MEEDVHCTVFSTQFSRLFQDESVSLAEIQDKNRHSVGRIFPICLGAIRFFKIKIRISRAWCVYSRTLPGRGDRDLSEFCPRGS